MNLKNPSQSLEKTKNNDSSQFKDLFNNFFITKIKNPQKTLKASNSVNDVILDRKILLEKHKIKDKEDEELKNNFFEFLGKNTNYLDIDKLTEYYQYLEEKQKHKYDKNIKIIEKKKNYLKELNIQVNKVIIENYRIDSKDIENLYDKKISEKKREIKLKKQELEMYHHLFSRTYKANYKLKNRLESEYKYQFFYNQQHEKYSILKNNTLYKLAKQEKLLNNLNQYFEKFVSTNEEIVGEKAKQLNKAEFEILLIKNDIISIEKEIENLKKRNLELEENIGQCQENYNSKKTDLSSIMKTYIKQFIKMEDIYQVIDVKNVGQILKKYNLLKKDYNNKSYKIKILSMNIMNLNNELKKKDNELESVHIQIENAKKELMAKKNNEKEESLILHKSQIKYLVSQIYDILQEKISIFSQCANNALGNIYKITESMKNASIKNPFNFDNKFTDEFNIFLSDDLKSINIDLEKEYDEKIMLKFVITLINSFYNFLANININTCYYLYKKILKERHEKTMRDNAESAKSSKDILKQKVENKIEDLKIYPLKSNLIINFYEKELNYSISRLNEKKKIYKRTPRDIFRQIYAEKTSKSSFNFSEFSNNIFSSPKNKDKNESVEISTLKESVPDSKPKKIKKEKILLNRNNSIVPKDDFMKMYYTFYRNSLKEKKSLNRSLPRLNYTSLSSHRFHFINKFINRNVSEKLTHDKKTKKIRERIKEKSKAITEKIKEKELIDFANKLNKKKYKNLSGVNTKDEGIDDMDKDMSLDQEKKEEQKRLFLLKKQLEESKKHKKYKLKSNEPEMNIISERLDDLRAIELYFSKNNKNKVLDASVFNEYYFKIKRVLSNAQNKLRESLTNNANKSDKIGYKKLSKTSKNKGTLKIMRRNNSDFFEGTDMKKMAEITTSKMIESSTKDKTRQSYFRLTYFNKGNKKDGTIPYFSNNIFNEENNIEEKV